MKQRKEIADAFDVPGTYIGEYPYGNGHINDTYCVVYENKGKEVRYIRQRINKNIFKDVPALMDNIGRVTRHQRAKFKEAGKTDINSRVLTLVSSKTGEDYIIDAEGHYWRTYIFLEGLLTLEIVEKPEHAFQTAKAFGEFQCQLADMTTPRLHETIPDFHNTRSRFNTLVKAIEADEFNRAKNVQEEINFVIQREKIVDVLLNLQQAGELPERITHNDTKLNNVLINADTGEGMCVIDLDTVMPGLALYDFGDMVRTATNSEEEDERDLSKVEMDINMYNALKEGYLSTAGDFLTPKEIELLPFSGQLITFEIGIRFLTDYLQNDVYFKIHRDKQNIDRCRKQFKMVESMEQTFKLT
ncbi:aminoglycoside phosphotransferase family protein [bacterium]|nr:aminoglycoside phosphotransferase family protein [bacterium]